MADKYSAIITNAGASYLLQNNLFSNGKFQVSKIEICDNQIPDLIESVSWNSMSEGGCIPVTTIEGTEEVNKVLRKVMIDDYVAQLRVTVGPEVGDIQNPTLPLSYGSIGVYLYKYNEEGEILYGQDILFMIGSLDTIFNKYMNSNLTAGNTVSFYLQAAVSNRPSIEEINVRPTEYFSIPSVPTEDDDKEKLHNYYNTYLVNNYDRSDSPALLLRNKSGDGWTSISSSNETASRLIPGGGIYNVNSNNNETKLPTCELGASGFIVRLPPNSTLAFPDGLGKDSTFKTKKFYLEFGLSTNEISGDDEWIILAIHNEGSFSLLSVRAEDFSLNPDKPDGNIYWYNRYDNLSYKIEGEVLNRVDFIEIASLKIKDGKVSSFRPSNVISSSSQSDYNYVNRRIDLVEEESRRVDNSVVHISEDENILGQKTFLRDVILYSTKGEESTTDLILKSGVDFSTNGSIQFLNSKSLEKGKFQFGVDGTGNTSIEVSALNSNSNKSFIKIDTGSTELNVIDASEDVKYSLTQNLVAYNHKNSDGTSKKINVEGSWNFAQDLSGQMFYGTSYRSIYGDLAEIYQGDEDFKPGTLVEFGGKFELTTSNKNPCGVISSKPGLLLNTEIVGDNGCFLVPLALIGRVPVRVIGKLRKFDKISLSEIPGVAWCSRGNEQVIGVALENKFTDNEGLVLCSTCFRIS